MRMYSKNAMPQLATMASTSGLLLNFKCPYHANVMKTFEQDNSAMGNQRVWMRVFIKSFFGRYKFAERKPRAVADVQNVNLVSSHGEKNPAFVMTPTVKYFADFSS